MYIPGSERRYIPFTDPRAVLALATNYLYETAGAVEKPGLMGLINQTRADVVTPQLALRPRLQNYASIAAQMNMRVIDLVGGG